MYIERVGFDVVYYSLAVPVVVVARYIWYRAAEGNQTTTRKLI